VRPEDDLRLQFFKILSYGTGTQPFFVSYLDVNPVGTCIVANNGGTSPPITAIGNANAGSSFTVKGPNGSMIVTGSPGQSNPVLSASGTFLVPGSYTVSGAGGPDMGPFSGTVTFPLAPTVVSPVSSPSLSVTRANGLTVTWTGGQPDGYVFVNIASALDSAFTIYNEASCLAPASAGTFTIPPYILLSLATGNFTSFVVQPTTQEVPFTATGLSIGLLSTRVDVPGIGGFTIK